LTLLAKYYQGGSSGASDKYGMEEKRNAYTLFVVKERPERMRRLLEFLDINGIKILTL